MDGTRGVRLVERLSHRHWLLHQAQSLFRLHGPATHNARGGFSPLALDGSPLVGGASGPLRQLYDTTRMVHCHALGQPGSDALVDHGMTAPGSIIATSDTEAIFGASTSREAYYLALRRTQGTIRTDAPDWTPWLEFFLRALQRQMQRLRIRVEHERLLVGEVSELQARLIELVREQGRLAIGDAATLTGVSRNTLKVQFRVLVRDGRLTLNGSGRGAWYSLR